MSIHDIEADYPELHLTALSDSVVDDLICYFEKQEIYDARDELADFLSDKARKVYAAECNAHFRKGLKPTKAYPDRHRDALKTWFQHWVPSELRDRKLLTHDEFQHLVHVEWSTGKPFIFPTYKAYQADRRR